MNTALAERDAGIRLVASNNEALNAGWQDLADVFLYQYAKNHGEFFPYEVTAAFEQAGLVLPTDDRAWGSVFLRAARHRIIARGTSIGKHPKRHAVAVLSWVSMVCRESA